MNTIIFITLLYIANILLTRWLNKILIQYDDYRIVPYVWFIPIIPTLIAVIIISNKKNWFMPKSNWFTGKNWKQLSTPEQKEDFKNETLQRAIDIHGHYKQMDMMAEEMGELLQALNKIKRLSNYSGVVEKPSLKHGLKYCLAYWNACSEIADNKLLLEQMEKIFDADSVHISEERKIIRLSERLNKNTF